MSKILVCGGGEAEKGFVFACLDRAHAKKPASLIIHAGSGRFGEIVEGWAMERGINSLIYRADPSHGRAAAHMQNEKMLRDGDPHAVVAFPGGREVSHMVSIAEAAGVPVWQPGPSTTTAK